jgi:transcriptional regulator with XRE-family HTH domain
MVERIQLILKTRGLSPSQFADEIKVQRSGVSHVLSGRNKPSLDFIMKILETYTEISPEWLLHGKGNMVKLQDGQYTGSTLELADKGDQGEIQFPDLPHKTTPPKRSVKRSGSNDNTIKEPKERNNQKSVEKIVIFYSDNTFREYNPAP